MKNILSALLLLSAILLQTQLGWAVTQTYTVSATVPTASSVNMTSSSINASNGTRTTVNGTALSFDPLTFNSANQVWLPDHFFSTDLASVGGGGGTDVTVNYTEGANPNNPSHGIGWKTTATFVKVSGTTETPLSAHGPKKMLKDLNAEHITSTELAGGSLRIYTGIVTKDPTASIPDPSTSEVFTNADKPGAYDGSLVITATVS